MTKQRPAHNRIQERARKAAYEHWAAIVKEVSVYWQRAADRARRQGLEPPWLDEERDDELHRHVREAIHASSIPRTRQAASEWRTAWLSLIHPQEEP
jgi:hypothetical protein